MDLLALTAVIARSMRKRREEALEPFAASQVSLDGEKAVAEAKAIADAKAKADAEAKAAADAKAAAAPKPAPAAKGIKAFFNGLKPWQLILLTIAGVVYFAVGVYSAYLSWSCNTLTHMSTPAKAFFAVCAFLGGFTYVVFYIAFRWSDCRYIRAQGTGAAAASYRPTSRDSYSEAEGADVDGPRETTITPDTQGGRGRVRGRGRRGRARR